MRIDYSKPLGDLAREQADRLRDDSDLLARQRMLSSMLHGCPPRPHCLLCHAPLHHAERFVHRSVPFVRCACCGHVQTEALPPAGYPHHIAGGLSFGTIYPRLSHEAYAQRRDRIYAPKRDWVLRVLREELGVDAAAARTLRWLDMGCGAGYFVSALHQSGMVYSTGFDADEHVVAQAREMLPHAQITVFGSTLDTAVRQYPADVYTAFFVMEHVDDPAAVYRALGALPAGTIFVFSVPLYGFSCLVEAVFDGNYARNLDAVVHTQLYTERSVAYAMQLAGMDIVAQWVFGQDAEDLRRVMLARLADSLPASMMDEVQGQLTALLDPLQHCLDRLHLADQRHILAIKR